MSAVRAVLCCCSCHDVQDVCVSRFTATARAVQQLPTQLYLSEQDLLGKSALELKVCATVRPWPTLHADMLR